MRKQSKRVAITKEAIESAYFEVLTANPGKKVTVKEICEVAQVNRTTFYKYYQDAEQLGEVVRSGMMDYLEKLLKETIPEDRSDMYEFVSRIITAIYRDKKVRSMFLLKNGDGTHKGFFELLWKYYYSPKYGATLSEEDWIRVTYCNSAVVGLVDTWIKDGMKISPEKIANSVISFDKSIRRNK